MVNTEKNNLKPSGDLLSKNAAYFSLLIIIVLGLFLRVYDLGSKSFWADEILSITASERIVDMNSFLSPDPYNAHPPLYFLTLKFWSSLGDGEYFLRLWSVLFGLFSALLIYLDFEGFVTIHYNKVEEVFTNFIENYGTEVALPSFIATNIPLAGSFALGFAFGIKKG